MILTAMFWLMSFVAHALPLEERSLIPRLERNDDATSPSFATGNAQTIYTVVSLACIFTLAFMIGFRTKAFRRQKPTFAKTLVLLQTFLGVSFVIASAVLVALGLVTQEQCYAAIVICLVFYTGAKMALYLFLLERAHVVRAPFVKSRFHDWVWVVGILIIVIGFGALSIVCYITPHAYLSADDGKCRIGADAIPSYLLLAFDAFVNLALTIVFVVLLRPVLRFRQQGSATNGSDELSKTRMQRSLARMLLLGKEKERETLNVRFWMSIQALLWKNVVGSTLIFLASAANLSAFYADKAIQLGWLCLVCCMADVTWGVIVVHWLTIGSTENERNISRTTDERPKSSVSTVSTAVPTPAPVTSKKSMSIMQNFQRAEGKEKDVFLGS